MRSANQRHLKSVREGFCQRSYPKKIFFQTPKFSAYVWGEKEEKMEGLEKETESLEEGIKVMNINRSNLQQSRGTKTLGRSSQSGGGQRNNAGKRVEVKIMIGPCVALESQPRTGMSNARQDPKRRETRDELLLELAKAISLLFPDKAERNDARGTNGKTSQPLANAGYRSDEVRVPKGQPCGGEWTTGALGDWQSNIRATIFGGKYDSNIGAITQKPVTDDQLGAALPGTRHKLTGKYVEIRYKGKSVIVPVVDLGPWYDGSPERPADPYWETNSRLKAETEHPYPEENGAGIDMSPATLRALGIPYAPHFNKRKHKTEWVISGDDPIVDWRFVPAPKQ